MKKLFTVVLLLLSISIYAQKQDLITYLNAYKTAEFEESQKIIADYSFSQEADYTISDYSTFEGIIFNTDIPTIKGYKAIGNCKIKNQAGGFIEKRMMVVLYFDKAKKHWSVFSLREVADSKHEYTVAKAAVEENKFYTDKEFVYRNLAYWSLLAGQVKDAKKYIDLAILSAKETTSSIPFSTFKIDVVIKSIM